MGFFSTKKTYVSSSVYNLAGDVDKRPDYLKTIVVGGTFDNDGSNMMGQTLREGYTNGPGMKLRSFFRWATANYQAIGIPSGNLGSVERVNTDVLADQIPADAGHKITVQYVHAGSFEASYWAEQYVFEHHPDRIDTNWTSDMNSAGEITITYADATTESFTPAANQASSYIYAIYSQVDNTTGAWSSPKVFIYRIGSGNTALDAAVIRNKNMGEYVPYIPLRLDNKWVSDVNPAAAVLAKKAYSKAFNGGKIQKLIDQIADNPDLKEIDYAYVMFGVPLNVKERASKEYLFRFFDKCRTAQIRSASDEAAWNTMDQSFDASVNAWASINSGILAGMAPTGTRGTQPAAFGNQVKITSNGSLNTNVNMTISWKSISESHGTGLKIPTAKKGDVWITYGAGGDTGGTRPVYGNGTFFGINLTGVVPIFIHWQVTDNSWRTLTITGLEHKNLIYKNKSVDISALDALQDTDESGFLVPLHYETLLEMNLIQSTQMMTAAAYIVFNSYKVVKKKWYQTGIFKIVLFIAIVAITVATAGTGTGPALAATTALLAAAGITGIVALVLAAIIDTIVAMIVAKLIMMGSTAVFGKKWGTLIGTILTVAVMMEANALVSGQSIGQSLQSFTSVTALLQLTSSVGNGIAGFVQGDTLEIMHKSQDLAKQSKLDLAQIQDLYDSNIGNSGVALDPMGLVSGHFDPYAYVQPARTYVPETSDDFLTRTLLTGTDIAELTIDIVSNFVDYSTRLDLPR